MAKNSLSDTLNTSQVYFNALRLSNQSGKIDDKTLINIALELKTLDNVKSRLNTLSYANGVQKALTEAKISQQVQKVVLLLLDSNTLDALPYIASAIEEYIAEKNGLEVIKVESYDELTDKEQKDIKSAIEKELNKKIELFCSVNKALLAGIAIKIASKTLDLSYKAKLRKLERELLK